MILDKMECPMPQFKFDIITLGHGSGGLLTNQLLESGVFEILKNPILNQKHDGAIFELSGKTAMSSDSFVINPIFFAGGDIGELAVNGTVNDLAMCGAEPKYLSLSFIIEEGLQMTEFWTILNSIKKACDKANVLIVTGDTKVVERGKGDKIFINTTGVGNVLDKANIALDKVKIGDKIILSGQIAQHGIAIMSQRNGLEFKTTIGSDTRPLNHICNDLVKKFNHNIHLLKDPTRGGLASVLNEVSRDRKIGINIEQNKIPIDNEVQSACELLGLDPLYVANEGLFVAFVEAQFAEEILAVIKKWQYGAHASIIGSVVETHLTQVLMQSAIGGKRIVNMLTGEQLPRIC